MHRLAMSLGAGVLSAIVLAFPGAVQAQDRASIVGAVRDATGAVMPGVTVEASSDALIEKVRTAITDESGRYTVAELRPGTYVVTFTLPGFKVVRREGVVLAGAFAATVNTELEVGGIEETVTVSGASPVVDLQSTQNQFVANREMLQALPQTRTIQGAAGLVPGVSFYAQGFVSVMSVHGSSTADQHIYFDGMNIGQNLTGTGSQANGTNVNDLGQEEMVFDAGSQTAETALGGVRMNSIPKEGGNRLSGTWRTFGSTGAWQSDNVPDDLREIIRQGDRLDYLWNTNVAVGGPIKKDKMWFFTALRVSQTDSFVANMYFADGSPANRGGAVAPHATVRLTNQLSPRNKISFAYYRSSGKTQRFDLGCAAQAGNTVACTFPEASYSLPNPLQYSSQIKWTSPVTSRLLLDVQQSLAVPTYKFDYQPENGPFDVQNREATNGYRTVASATAPNDYFAAIWNTVATVSYVTGSHALKGGINYQAGHSALKVEPHGDVVFLGLTNGQARTVTVRNSPYTQVRNLNADLGLFVQDKWALGRLTLTGGARYDYFNASTPDNTAPAGNFVPARSVEAVSCIPCNRDWSIRAGASFDLFGNGKTALKTSIGKFLASQALGGITASVDPLQAQTESRAWTDLDGNRSVLAADGSVQYAEIGPSRNSRFGVPAGATRMDPDLKRGNNWEQSVSIQHELLPRVSTTFGYYHRTFHNLTIERNLAVDPFADYTPFTIASPLNGEAVMQYNLNLNKFQQVDNFFTNSPTNTREYDGVELSVNARIPGGGFIFGGITTERLATRSCDVADPNNLRFCDQSPPFRTLYKVSAAYTLPFEVQLSGSFQARPGISIGSSYTYDSAAARIALTGGGTRTVTLIDPTTQFYDYVSQVDFRVGRNFRLGGKRLQGFLEVFNLANASTLLTVNETIGPLYLRPQAIAQGRRMQLGVQLDF